MHLSENCKQGRLPKRFPVGSTFVVETPMGNLNVRNALNVATRAPPLKVRCRAKPPSPSPSITRCRTPVALAAGVHLFMGKR